MHTHICICITCVMHAFYVHLYVTSRDESECVALIVLIISICNSKKSENSRSHFFHSL